MLAGAEGGGAQVSSTACRARSGGRDERRGRCHPGRGRVGLLVYAPQGLIPRTTQNPWISRSRPALDRRVGQSLRLGALLQGLEEPLRGRQGARVERLLTHTSRVASRRRRRRRRRCRCRVSVLACHVMLTCAVPNGQAITSQALLTPALHTTSPGRGTRVNHGECDRVSSSEPQSTNRRWHPFGWRQPAVCRRAARLVACITR